MKKVTMVAVAMSAILFSFTSNAQSTWGIDKAHSKLGFTITHMGVSDVEGSFKVTDATITSATDDFNGATVELTADATSVNTDQEARDKHVKSDAFLDVAKFPAITFKSTSFKKVSANAYVVTGNLTLHGVTKPVTLNATLRQGVGMNKKPVAGFKISGTFNRKDFGVGTGFGSAMLSDEITLAANTEFDKM
ncbi:polyisoprenoid-binding protein YceI [Mucilaginibacter gracilis]|uniref:Polyisoprenoid-binding protein YceI n=1 Tax=Mucilaginibacter gracilis TaxID=423350 RepID=A0A495IVU7_9SPHI|nr:YceI family protein [Mucilaginibacter gracilis]RKR80876.1 polyisoprenoid-binding protein YceI [Mucilaginibacter gracilis]